MGKRFKGSTQRGPKTCALCSKVIKGSRGVPNGFGGHYHAKCLKDAEKSSALPVRPQ